MIGKCLKCNATKNLIEKRNVCHACQNEWMRQYYRKNREVLRAKEKIRTKKRRQDIKYVESERVRGRQYLADLRHNTIMAYGGYKCNCCGETEPLFLTIDHINNDGANHRRAVKKSSPGNGKGGSTAVYKWLRDNGYPKGFQILCMNCNFGKSRNKGVCPHKEYHNSLCEFGGSPERTIPSQDRESDKV